MNGENLFAFFLGACLGFMCAFFIVIEFYPESSDGQNFKKEVIKEYQCEKIEGGTIKDIDGKATCVLSIKTS